MSRFTKMPDGYKWGGKVPGLVLSLREQMEGGNLRKEVYQIPLYDSYSRIEAVVLIHGFNNHSGEAGEAYLGFRSHQCQCELASQIPLCLEKVLTDVFWPGDASGWGISDLADAAIYPLAVDTAKEAAPRLAKHLRSMPNLRTVHFIGHSLGCRIILETIENLRLEGGPTVGKVCLMAAAVPVYKIQSIGALSKATEFAQEILILYSYADSVLHYTFPTGQTLSSGDEGHFPTALGFQPPQWIAGKVRTKKIDNAEHGDYWGHSESKEPMASNVAREIDNFFGFSRSSNYFAERKPTESPRLISAKPRGFSRRVIS